MSKISESAARQNEHLDLIEASLAGITEDVRLLNEMIENLQNNPGPISEEDQQTLNALEARGAALAEKMSALDAANPKPTEPPPPAEPTP